jgi:hypothetical protein
LLELHLKAKNTTQKKNNSAWLTCIITYRGSGQSNSPINRWSPSTSTSGIATLDHEILKHTILISKSSTRSWNPYLDNPMEYTAIIVPTLSLKPRWKNQ